MRRSLPADRSEEFESDQHPRSYGWEPRRSLARLALVASLGIAAFAAACDAGDPANERAAAEWRESRLDGLRSEYGWLSPVGLHWLAEGATTFGSDPSNGIVIAGEGIPAVAGTFELNEGAVLLRPSPNGGLRLGEAPLTEERLLASDATGAPDDVFLGPVRMRLLDRGGRLGIRLRDPGGPARRDFTGLDYFEYDESLRVEARWVTFDDERLIKIPNVLGTTSKQAAAGRAEFEIGGEKVSIYGTEAAEGRIFFIFGDGTNGHESYGAGRFLYSDPPADGRVILDFNRSYNPPCAFTPFATCPLPPRENKLAVRVEAGEKSYGDHG